MFFPQYTHSPGVQTMSNKKCVWRNSKRPLTNPWPVIELDHFQGDLKEPYTVAFVYAKSGNVVVKGMSSTVGMEIDDVRRFGNCIYYATTWRAGIHRGIWLGTPGIFISRKKINRRRKFCINIFVGYVNEQAQSITRYFRRMPRRWLPLYDLAIVGGSARYIVLDGFDAASEARTTLRSRA